jgi:AcrR family transcriptional regulator
MPDVAERSTEDRILDATMAVLARRGRRLSMTDVASAAGVSRMTLYRYYSTKAELLAALARHEQRRFDDRLGEALDEPLGAPQRVDAVLRAIVSFQREAVTHAVVEAEPGFIIEWMRRSLPVQRATLERLIGESLGAAPAVRAGNATPADVADLILRVAMSHFLLPHTDPDALLRALRISAGL